MTGFSFLSICLLISFVEQVYCGKEILQNGSISELFGLAANLGKSARGWPRGSNMFESNDEIKGAWVTLKSTMLHNISRYKLDIEVERTECTISGRVCSLQIFIFNGTKELLIPNPQSHLENWKEAARDYFFSKFRKLHDINFTEYNKIERKSFHFSYNGSKAIIAFRATEIKGVLHNIEMYYYYCKKTIKDGVELPLINTPNGMEIVPVNCTSNAISNESDLNGVCLYNGTWTLENNTKCLCKPGYEMLDKGCQGCEEGYYKSKTSNGKCSKCPSGSTNNRTYTACNCKDKKYRLKDHLGVSSEPCYGFPSKVRDIKFKKVRNSPGTIILSWKTPEDNGGLPDSLKYDIDCGDDCQLTFRPRRTNLTKTTVTISDLKSGRKYNFKISSKNRISMSHAKGHKFANKTYEYPNDRSVDDFMIRTEYQIAAGIGVLLIIILIIVLIFILRRKRHKHSKCIVHENGVELPDIGQKMYVDPMNYVDAEAALKEFANEIDPDSFSLEDQIGGGEFGDVYKGTLILKDGKTISVAAKTLKPNADRKSFQDFFLEASAMGQFDDPNVIHLEGVITKAIPKMIIIEFMLNGSLDHFLKKNEGGFTAIQLFTMARGVASGMKYLAGINFVHRDLAARNVLVDENMTCKVADFGLSREVETTDSSQGEYFTQGGKIPVRWTAPEAIKYRVFSTASDIWSFGVLLWEIMSSAQRPYWDWDNFKVMERVDSGFRLPRPVNCPQAVHELMLKCWDKERSLRPRFHDILDTIDEWIESPESLHRPSLRNERYVIPRSTSVEDWLNEIKMSSYMPHFAAAGYERLSDLVGLLDNDLKALGISLVGHRNKMLRTIRSLPIAQEKNI